MLKIFTLPFLFLLFAYPLFAQNQDLDSDRPNQTQSPTVLPKGTVQLENGLQFEKDHSALYNQQEFYYPTVLVRYGLLKRGEVRVSFDYDKEKKQYLSGSHSGETEISKGFHEVKIGTKINLLAGDKWVPEIGFLGNITLPVGNPAFNPPHIAPEVILLFSNKISEKLQIQYNVGLRKKQQAEEFRGEGLYTVVANVKISQKVAWFVEVFGLKPNGKSAEHSFDAGFLIKLLPNFQVDLVAGFGLTQQAPDAQAGAGFTWRIPK